MCFKITFAQREYYRYRGISADLERRGFGSSRAELAWAIREKHYVPEMSIDNQDKRENPSPLTTRDSN
jgi:hypothetical protein